MFNWVGCLTEHYWKYTYYCFTIRLRNSVRIVEDQYIVLSKYLSHLKMIPPMNKSLEVKEVNDSLVEIDKKIDPALC